MPGKKKKYNARFPPARIKKIMQSDEEVGKVAAPVPVIISRTLELFVQSLLTRAGEITVARQARTLTPSHLKQCIISEQRFDFLQELFSTVPDITSETDLEVTTPPVTLNDFTNHPRLLQQPSEKAASNYEKLPLKKEPLASGRGRGRGRGRPRKAESLDIPKTPKRPRGRPRKIQSYVCSNEDEDDEEEEDILEIESSDEVSENGSDVFDSSEANSIPPKTEIQTFSDSINRRPSTEGSSLVSSCTLDGGIHITIPSLGTSTQPILHLMNSKSSGINSGTSSNLQKSTEGLHSPLMSSPMINSSGSLTSPTITFGSSNGTKSIPVPVITSVESAKLMNCRSVSCSRQEGIDEDYDC